MTFRVDHIDLLPPPPGRQVWRLGVLQTPPLSVAVWSYPDPVWGVPRWESAAVVLHGLSTFAIVLQRYPLATAESLAEYGDTWRKARDATLAAAVALADGLIELTPWRLRATLECRQIFV